MLTCITGPAAQTLLSIIENVRRVSTTEKEISNSFGTEMMLKEARVLLYLESSEALGTYLGYLDSLELLDIWKGNKLAGPGPE